MTKGHHDRKYDKDMRTPEENKQAKRSIIGETGLNLLEEEAIDMIIQRDVTGYTLGDIAQALDINESTLWRWRQRDDFNDVMLEKAEEIQRHSLNDAYTSMRGILMDPKAKTHNKLKVIEMILRNQGRLKEVTENTHEVEDSTMSDLMDKLDSL